MFWPPSSRSQPKREPSASPPVQPQTSKPRSLLARAAHKLKKVFTAGRSENNHVDVTTNPLTHQPATHTTSARLSEAVFEEVMTPFPSSRSNDVSLPPMLPSGAPSSDSSNADGHPPITHWSRTSTAAERPPSSDHAFDAEPTCTKSSPRWRKVENLEGMPITTAWRLFTGEVGSIRSSTESSPPTGSVTTEEWVVLHTQRRAGPHRYSYLKYIGGLTEEQLMKRDLARRARARQNAYLTLDKKLGPRQQATRDLERRARRREYSYLKCERLTEGELLERDVYRRDRARLHAYWKLTSKSHVNPNA